MILVTHGERSGIIIPIAHDIALNSPIIDANAANNTFSGTPAVYDRWAHSRCMPPVMPSIASCV